MLVCEWETALFEAVVERHTTTSRLRVERPSKNEVLIDCGKFSCAVTFRMRNIVSSLVPSAATIRAVAAVLLVVATFGAASGVSEAAAWAARTHLNTTFPPE